MKTWLITGCSSGLGRSIARNTALVTALDVTDQTSIEQAVTAAQERFGTIDVLINNAGYG